MSIVLCIAPHPDDETLGCGGSLLRHKYQGDEIHWLIVTTLDGSNKFTNEKKETRATEIKNVAKAYDFNSFHQFKYLTTELDTIPASNLITEISNYFKIIKPEIIYLPFAGDIHSDHRIVFDAVTASSKSFRHPYTKVLRSYETLSETEFNIDPENEAFKPNLWIDISDFLEEKIEIMKIYKGEMGEPPFPRSEENLRALARLRGSTANFQNAEAFITLKEYI
ncbi:MAG: PIG-L family deacetylase [Gammaproteobacteria bacterium]|nr:PIG-L family deacetylase [Gammaproteobacteria bacterium]